MGNKQFYTSFIAILSTFSLFKVALLMFYEIKYIVIKINIIHTTHIK